MMKIVLVGEQAEQDHYIRDLQVEMKAYRQTSLVSEHKWIVWMNSLNTMTFFGWKLYFILYCTMLYIIAKVTRFFLKDSPTALRSLSLCFRGCMCTALPRFRNTCLQATYDTFHVRRGIFKKRSTEPNKKQVASAAWTAFCDETPAHIRNRADT